MSERSTTVSGLTRPFGRRAVLRAGLAGAAGLFGAPLLGACSSGAGSAGKGLEFVWPGTSDVERAVAKDFNASWGKAHGGDIRFDYLAWNDMNTQLAARIRAKNPPDATMLQDVTQFVQLDGLADLTDRAKQAGFDAASKDYVPGVVPYSMIDGRLYSVPYLAGAFTLIVNTTLLKAAGMTTADLASWDDVVAAARRMTRNGVYGISYPLGNPRFAFRQPLTIGYSNGLRLDDTTSASTRKWTELLDHIKALQPYSPPAQATWDYPDMWRAYATGKVGMAVGGTYVTANVYSINSGIVAQSHQMAYPAGPSGGHPSVPVTSVGYGVFAAAKNSDAAWDAVHELSGDQWSARMAAAVNIPAKTTVTASQLAPIVRQTYPKAVAAHERITAEGITAVHAYGKELVKIKGQTEMEQAIQPLMLKLVKGAPTDVTRQAIATAFDGIAKKYA